MHSMSFIPTSLCRADRLLIGAGVTLVGSVALFGTSWLAVGIPAAGFVALLTDGIARPSSSVLYPTVSRGPADERRVALTFDDGPDPEVTPIVLDALKAHQAAATFFAIGRSLEQHRALARRIVAEGHELASHSWQHSRWQNFFGSKKLGVDLERTRRLIGEINGDTEMPLFRAPFGLKSPELARAATPRQVRMIAWSLHSRDTRTRDPRRVAKRVLERIEPGDIVLLHDGHDLPGRHREVCKEAVPLILTGLRQQQLQPVTVSKLLNQSSIDNQVEDSVRN
jgi:peptidoglycan/xylan/chitin deacetylase (PgdA/CDA1 family)